MSLINQMLKDLEKRRSRDLETSDTLNQNISWETRPNQKSFNWLTFSIIFTLVALMSVIAYLLWERTTQPAETEVVEKSQPAPVKKTKFKKVVASKKIKAKAKKPAVAKTVIEDSYNEDIDIDDKVRLMGAAEHMLIGLIGEAEGFLQIERKDLFKIDLEPELAIDKIKIGDRGVAEYIIEIQVDRSIRAVGYIFDLQSYLAELPLTC